MNRWNNLSMSEKNQLLGIYVSKGYTDLASIISHYNSFATGGQIEIGDNPKRKKRNDSRTQAHSEKYEDQTARHIATYNANKINHSYDIPYIQEKEITVPGVGRVSTNTLDSIAKYSYMAGIPLEEGLGLAAQETKFGAIPYLNFNRITRNMPKEEKERKLANNNALANSSYFRNYGTIPANYLVRDWHYFDLTDEQRRNTPPLLDAFNYWKQGKYNPSDPNHTSDVRAMGQKVMAAKIIQEWMKDSPYVKKNNTINTKKKKK